MLKISSRIQVVTNIDKETGEVLSKYHKEVRDYFDVDKGYRFLARTKSIRLFPVNEFPKEISMMDKGRLFSLSQMSWADSGLICKIKGRKIEPSDDNAVIVAAGFSVGRKGSEWLKRMVNLSMLRSVDINLPDDKTERQWYLNPLFFCPMYINRQSFLIWRDQIEKKIPSNIVDLLGGLAKEVNK